MVARLSIEPIQWIVLSLFGIGFFLVAPLSRSVKEFFHATDEKGTQPGLFVLTGSLVISWIFAKSITNAANLGQEFGIVGGIAYSLYYLSFMVAGWIIYDLRTKGGFKSIHQFLQLRYGKQAVIVFSLLITFRLFNEVWSNTMVIGSYFGSDNSASYYSAILIFTFFTLAYTLKGGLRSSLLTDAVQMIFFSVLLVILLAFILPTSSTTAMDFVKSGSWTFSGGLNLIGVVLIQIFSYPFHDSVMTDRGFITNPKLTLKSFLLAGIIGIVCIFAFSLIGVYAKLEGIVGNPSVKVASLFGLGILLSMNLIMVTSAASTLDSAFSSFSKLMVMDIGKTHHKTVNNGRITMILMAILGSIPVFLNPEILSATTISGTMVLGLAPIFIFWKLKVPKSSYFISVSIGLIMGTLLALGLFPKMLIFTEGRYSDLFSSNLIGTLLCFIGFFLPYVFSKVRNN